MASLAVAAVLWCLDNSLRFCRNRSRYISSSLFPHGTA
jgi:hypothetical protein